MMHRRWAATLTLAAAAITLVACQSEPPAAVPAPPSVTTPTPLPDDPTLRPVPRQPIGTTVVATGLETPWGIAFLPDGSALVSQRRLSEIVRVTPAGRVSTIGTVSGLSLDTDEGGLLGLAIPSGRSDVLYAYMTTADDNRVVRMAMTSAGLGAPEAIVTGIPKGRNHNGGRIAFGSDGYLYIATGDARQPERAQDTSALNGKILRVDQDGRVPEDNPFGNAVYSYGHRNVQGLAFDSSGGLWATEFGQDTTDELNRIRAGSNYGWPIVEGTSDDPRFVAPFASWSPTSTASPSGIAIVDDVAYIGAHRGQALFAVPLAGPDAGRTTVFLENQFGRIRTVVRASDASLWISTTNRDGYLAPDADDDRLIRVDLSGQDR